MHHLKLLIRRPQSDYFEDRLEVSPSNTGAVGAIVIVSNSDVQMELTLTDASLDYVIASLLLAQRSRELHELLATPRQSNVMSHSNFTVIGSNVEVVPSDGSDGGA